jgi:hypothetical protein
MTGLGSSTVAALVLGSTLLAATAAPAAVPSPQEVLGVAVGSNGSLASYTESLRYLEALDAASDRVAVIRVGATVEGRAMVVAAISTPANLGRLGELRAGWARVADPRGLDEAARARLLAELPSCALITAGIHATEVAGPQAALVFAHRLAAAPEGSREVSWLERTVVLLLPSLNPDGQEAVVAWYRRWVGTPFEGSQPPFLYHRYAGHDNNRDFVFLTQPESRALNRLVYHDWHPQLFLDLHQMGPLGPRQFVPPFADPIAPNVHPLVWRVTSHLGTLMSLRLEENGHRGVVSGWTFDGNWIGGTRNTGWWKNVFGVLTETASAALAAPIDIDENELRGGGKGLVDYRAQVNFPNPWPGGRWGLADAVAYQLDVMGAFVEFAGTYRRDVLGFVAEMAESAVARGRDEAPRSFVVPPSSTDPRRSRKLVELLVEGGAEGYLAHDGVTVGGTSYPAGTVVFPAAQPLRQFLVEVTQRQRYPEISPAPGAELLLPYDITAWTLPLYLGAALVEADDVPVGRLTRIEGTPAWPAAEAVGEGSVLLLPAGQLDAVAVANRALGRGLEVRRLTAASEFGGRTFAAGSLAIAAPSADLLDGAALTGLRVGAMPNGAAAVRRVVVGIYHPDFGLEDAGWLRFVLENAGFPVEVVDNRAIRSRAWRERLGVLLLPALDGKTLVDGNRRQGAVPMPPDYRDGIGKDGVEAIRSFLSAGGTVIGFGGSAEWLAETLELPVTDTLKGVGRADFYCPGSLLTLDLDAGSPLAWGMPARVVAMVEDGSAFQTRPVGGEERRAVVARYPEEPLLQSGWIRGEERLQRRAAEVEVRRGEGRVVLFAFAPHFRGQSAATFPLLYNAVLAEMMDPAPGARPARGKS